MNPVLRSMGLLLFAAVVSCQSSHPPLAVVDGVDLDRYSGRWYEIASFPQRFQRDCVATTVDYTRMEDGRIRVENQCRDRSFEGPIRRIEGVAWLADPEASSARLKVQFFWPFSGDYWVIELDADYRYAVVGHPSRQYLWILSREPTMDAAELDRLRSRIAAKGYDISQLNETPQPPRSSRSGADEGAVRGKQR